MKSIRPAFLLAALAGALIVACADDGATSTSEGPLAAAASATLDRQAVRVPQGYEPPKDRVASTGATVPVNGKPTLVFVDAIW